MRQLLSNLGLEGSTLVITEGSNEALLKSMSNLRGVDAVSPQLLSVAETTRVRNMVVTVDAAKRIDETAGAPVRKPAVGARRK